METEWKNGLASLLRFVQIQMETIDAPGTKHGFLHKLVEDLKGQDEISVQALLVAGEAKTGSKRGSRMLSLSALSASPEIGRKKMHPVASVEAILASLKASGEIELRDGLIFSRRGGAKLAQNLDLERRRRQSFSSTSFGDQDALLRVERLKEMSDLNFLFSLNGYHLPWCESSKQRSMYEGFFAAFLREVHAGRTEAHSLRVLQEAIIALYITSELCVDFLECLFEVIGIVRSASKIAALGSPREGADREIYKPLDEALEAFNDPDKVFGQFKSRKLLNSKSGRRDGESQPTWLTKYNDYCDVLNDAIELHGSNCFAFRAKMEELRGELGAKKSLTDRETKRIAFCNDVIVYVQSYADFLASFSARSSRFLTVGRELLAKIETAEKSPRKKLVKSASRLSGLLFAAK